MGGVENRVEAVAPGALEGPAKPGESAAEYVARLASEKAVNLTNQLLIFSRGRPVQESVFDLNELLIDHGNMLKGNIGPGIELVVLPNSEPVHINLDVDQMTHLLMNLTINARDAMPRGGKIIIYTSKVTVDENQANLIPDAVNGQCVRLSVRDNGIGMTEEIRPYIFEPFFTTKEVGKGTGLGLATCYGFIKQCGGFIEVESELGRGTCFRVFIPLTDESHDAPEASVDDLKLPGGSETVLLVEDESLILIYASKVLRDEGYRVLEVANGEQALDLTKNLAGDESHLLLSDVVMPRMGGLELAERFRDVNPSVPVLFTSGYADQSEFSWVLKTAAVGFLPKPYDPK